MSNKQELMEAAAEILAGSKAKAPAMPPESLSTEIQDLGGPTPFNGNPTDDSEKLNIDQNTPDNSQKNKKTIEMKPSDAKMSAEELSADIDTLFSENVSEEFKDKAKTLFEARVHDKYNTLKEELEITYGAKLEEAVKMISEDLTEKVDGYLSYVVEGWLEDNKVAIEASLRTEIAEDFMSGLHKLFTENFITIPEEKIDMVDQLSEKVVDLEDRLNEEINRNIEISKSLNESKRGEVINKIGESLTDTQKVKLKTLAESVEFTSEGEFTEKVTVIKENYFPNTTVKPSAESFISESLTGETTIVDPYVAAVANAIKKLN